MKKDRKFHACSSFMLGNSNIGVVVGGEISSAQNSVEYINFNDYETSWKSAPDFPRTSEDARKGHKLVSNGQTLLARVCGQTQDLNVVQATLIDRYVGN